MNEIKEAQANFEKMLEEVRTYANSLIADHQEYTSFTLEIGRTYPMMGSMEFAFTFRDTETFEPCSMHKEWDVYGEAKLNHITGEVGITCENQEYKTNYVDYNGYITKVA